MHNIPVSVYCRYCRTYHCWFSYSREQGKLRYFFQELWDHLTHVKYRYSKLGHAVVMSICNIDVWQRKKYLIPAVSCYFMSLLDKVSYLLDSIMLLSQIIDTMITTVKFERNKLPFTIEDILKGEFNWNMYEITPPCYVINICILYQLYFKQNDFLKEKLIGYTRANFHHATTFGCRNIAFQIWWLPCNPHRSEWPKTFWVVYMHHPASKS